MLGQSRAGSRPPSSANCLGAASLRASLGCRHACPAGISAVLSLAPGYSRRRLQSAHGQLLEHLAAIEGTTVPDQGILVVLARAGAQLLVSGIELDGAYDAA
jgi:hypothetical protein